MTIIGLLAGFVFTALITLLVGLEEMTSLLAQMILFVLLLSFQISMLYLGILQGQEAITTWHASKTLPRSPSIPIFKYSNLLSLVFIQLLGIFVSLMFFLRTLVYLGLISIVLGGAIFSIYLVYVIRPFLELSKSYQPFIEINQE